VSLALVLGFVPPLRLRAMWPREATGDAAAA
jgi:hypothetical protein